MAFQQFPQKGGIPSGNTAARPSSPIIGDTFYNGQLEILEIWNGSSWVAVSAPPSTPQIISVTDASTGDAYTSTAGKLAVVLAAGSGGGTPSQYNVFTVSGGHSASTSSTTITLTGLTPGTSYEVYGNGQNNFGTTVNTPNQAAVTPSTRPQVPTIGTTTLSSGLPVVNWTLGSNGGKNLSAITITPYLNGTTAQTSRTAATTSSTSYTFTSGQLTEDSSYTFKVKVTNANGDSPESSASNSVTVNETISMGYLVVAGGGAGGPNHGGGGAGGLRSTVTATGGGGTLETALEVTAGTNYTVTVGGGGAGASYTNQANRTSGTNSVFSTITSTGGGKGGSDSTGGPATGGSGGGGASGGTTGASGTANQGRAGGNYFEGSGNNLQGGGGGGASTAGTNGLTGGTGGQGGNGVAVSITGSSVTYAGGGGGAYQASAGSGTGGTGGGGNPGNPEGPSGSGTANTGGGGAGSAGGSGTSGSGGSGIVILRWLTSDASITVGAGLTADSTGTDGSYSYKRFTAGSGNVSFA